MKKNLRVIYSFASGMLFLGGLVIGYAGYVLKNQQLEGIGIMSIIAGVGFAYLFAYKPP